MKNYNYLNKEINKSKCDKRRQDNKLTEKTDHSPPCYRLQGHRFQNETFHFGSNPHLE